MIGGYIDVTQRKQAEDQKSLLIAELDHRVKNNLPCVAGIAQSTRDTAAALALLASGPTRAGFVAPTISVAATVVAACRINAWQVMASLEATPGHAIACSPGTPPYSILPPPPAVAVERGAQSVEARHVSCPA